MLKESQVYNIGTLCAVALFATKCSAKESAGLQTYISK